MEKNKENKSKTKLNDELLNNVAGGVLQISSDDYLADEENKHFVYSLRYCGSEYISDFFISACPNCGSDDICMVYAYT